MKNVPKKPVKKTMSKRKKCTIVVVIVALVLALGITLWLWLRPEPVVVSSDDGSIQLTNRDFAYFYWTRVHSCMEDGLDVDLTKPLSEQSYSQTQTEDTRFMVRQAQTVGFELPDEEQKLIDDEIVNFQDTAMGREFASVDAYLCYLFGDGSDLESFKQYLYYEHLAKAYSNEMLLQSEPTEEELLAYYEERMDLYGEDGLEQAHSDLHREKYYKAFQQLSLTFPVAFYPENISLTAPDGLYE